VPVAGHSRLILGFAILDSAILELAMIDGAMLDDAMIDGAMLEVVGSKTYCAPHSRSGVPSYSRVAASVHNKGRRCHRRVFCRRVYSRGDL